MNHSPERNELLDLLDALCSGVIAPPEQERLQRILAADPAARQVYFDYLDLHLQLRRWQKAEAANRRGDGRGTFGEGFGDWEIGDSGFGVRDSGFGIGDSGLEIRDFNAPNLQIPSLSTTHYPLSTNFVGGPVFSYIAATLILGVMMLGAWAYKISHDYGFSLTQNSSHAKNSRGLTAPGEPAQRPALIFVGRVTGMKDCRWSDPATGTYAGAAVPLGRKYSLSSGLMEITYRSGAKVILEGPCSYKVESNAGGYLALGKLTAKVEKGSEVGGPAASAASAQPQAARSQVPSPKPQDLRPKTKISKSPNLQISKFTVRTPTAVVTDLGTEFGVEVSANGDTTSLVFQGKVVVRAEGPAASAPEGLAASAASGAGQIVIGPGQSARVEKDNKSGVAGIVSGGGAPPLFVRELPSSPQMLDLLDVVAGGNGWGRRRECGIDATSGEVDFRFAEKVRKGTGQYAAVAWSKLIDGVFIPNGGAAAVRLDSAGHAFDGFIATANNTYGSLFARAAEIGPDKSDRELQHWVYRIGRCREFMPQDRGLLTFCPNVGITFDLAAVRTSNPGLRPTRLRATVGMGDVRPYYPAAGNLADFWVFVDGRLKLRRERLCPQDGAVEIDVELGPRDRFLTLVSTNAGDSRTCDWVVVGDPALEMASTNTEKK